MKRPRVDLHFPEEEGRRPMYSLTQAQDHIEERLDSPIITNFGRGLVRIAQGFNCNETPSLES